MPNCNPEQLRAIHHFGTPLLVLAGAGCGKTLVIMEKIYHLINERKIADENIAAITFTNKAANEMKMRLQQLLGPHKVRVSTFHTLGLNIIESKSEAIDYKNKFSIFDQRDCLSIIKNLLRDYPLLQEKEAEAWQQQISLWKTAFLTPTEILRKKTFQPDAATLYQRYQEQLQAFNAFDFDDLIISAINALQNDAALCAEWQKNIRYILVDEYQDTNPSQYLLLKLLKPDGFFTVVGDDDQAIYGFRGATSNNIFLLQQDFPDLTVIPLEQNYRSCQNLLEAANHLIANNPHPYPKRLWSKNPQGQAIALHAFADPEMEANGIAALLLAKKYQADGRNGDYAILYRSNHQARRLEKALRQLQIPYVISGGMSWFEREEIKDLQAFIRILYQPEDNMAWLRAIQTPKRDIGAVTLTKLGNYAKTRDISLQQAAAEMGLKAQIGAKAFAEFYFFQQLVTEYSFRAAHGNALEAIKDFLSAINYQAWLTAHYDVKTAEKRWQNIQEVLIWFSNIDREKTTAPSIKRIAEQLSLMNFLDRDKSQDCVQLATLHAVKGLEFSHVFIISLEEGILPHKNSQSEENIQEERRLLYVGLTRAKYSLTLSYSTHRQRYGKTLSTMPSRFLSEIPQQYFQAADQKNSIFSSILIDQAFKFLD
jgi:ATP-dependent DNA helicase Rep